MSNTELLIKEICHLPSDCITEVLDFVGYLKQKKAAEMEKASEMMLGEYTNNPELTAFCALDGEDFYDETR
jgi:hypothetical protein